MAEIPVIPEEPQIDEGTVQTEEPLKPQPPKAPDLTLPTLLHPLTASTRAGIAPFPNSERVGLAGQNTNFESADAAQIDSQLGGVLKGHTQTFIDMGPEV